MVCFATQLETHFHKPVIVFVSLSTSQKVLSLVIMAEEKMCILLHEAPSQLTSFPSIEEYV